MLFSDVGYISMTDTKRTSPLVTCQYILVFRNKNLDSFLIIYSVITVSELMELCQCMSVECFTQEIFCIASISHIFGEYSSPAITQLANYPVLHVETTNENSFLLPSDDLHSYGFSPSECISKNVLSVFKIYII